MFDVISLYCDVGERKYQSAIPGSNFDCSDGRAMVSSIHVTEYVKTCLWLIFYVKMFGLIYEHGADMFWQIAQQY